MAEFNHILFPPGQIRANTPGQMRDDAEKVDRVATLPILAFTKMPKDYGHSSQLQKYLLAYSQN